MELAQEFLVDDWDQLLLPQRVLLKVLYQVTFAYQVMWVFQVLWVFRGEYLNQGTSGEMRDYRYQGEMLHRVTYVFRGLPRTG